ncbi:MAG: T9SS type A sorting domain-containing protein, partial [Bacteroidia bacterium]|nr:T9SS type A sorting domain-containing protein [Bacteroidia bacterium]
SLKGVVYPNPSNGLIQLRLETSFTGILNLRLLNSSARELEVLSREILPGTTELTLDFTHLPAGLYLLHLQKEEAHQVIKILIE